MNRASLFTLMILLTVVVISSISSPLAPASNGVSLPKSGYSLESRIILNQFGQVYVNETLIESVNATSALQSITMCFPQQYSGHIFDIRATLNKGSGRDRKSTRLNSSHTVISYAVFCLKKKKK